MKLYRLAGRSATGCARLASVWKRGEVKGTEFALSDGMGKQVPVQSRVTAWWPDGSVKWAAHAAMAEEVGESCTLTPGIPCPPRFSLEVNEQEEGFRVNTGCMSLWVPRQGEIVRNVCLEGRELIERAVPVFRLERRSKQDNCSIRRQYSYEGKVTHVTLEEAGPLQAVFRMEGVHIPDSGMGCSMPFIIRLQLTAGSPKLAFSHTFLFDGEEDRDYLGGMGLTFMASLGGKPQERQIRFGSDTDIGFHEGAVLLKEQAVLNPGLRRRLENWESLELPVWQHYSLCQDSAGHFSIKKGTGEGCCMINAMQGSRAPGIMSAAGTEGSVSLVQRDFWQKYPAGLETEGLGEKRTACTAWFYSPEVSAYDFRHYDTHSYPQTLYEGFDWVDASAKGIAVTSECIMALGNSLPDYKELELLENEVQHPAIYTASPEQYHEAGVFGPWSLPDRKNEVEAWLEEQLSRLFEFYRDETERRGWYGLFDYGDIMHSYDVARHCWRYDMGGFAWQNTELVPTYWLWLYFLRTGRADVFDFAEAMTRHCADVDFYHFGLMKGIGSRHNVRHWGCSCKEPRIGMAGHHRFYYFLTGNQRIGDAMEDALDADKSMKNLRYFRQKSIKDRDTVSVRSGPDWTSFVSNWMTHYERTLEGEYRRKIETGIACLEKAPLRLASGPDFDYDPETSELIYHGENEDTGDMHLQICQGGSEIWMETADYLSNDTLREMLVEYGRFYFLSAGEKERASGGLIKKRRFPFPYFAAALGAYSANAGKDSALAKEVWQCLLHAIAEEDDVNGFEAIRWAVRSDGRDMLEIPWLSTNFAAQWALNTIVALELIKEELPRTMREVKEMLRDLPEDGHHRA